MNQKITTLIISFLLFFASLSIFTYSNEIYEAITFSLSLWMNNLIPSLFPFFFLSEFMIEYGFAELMSEALKGLMESIFHLPGSASFPFVMSMISGFPSGARYTKMVYDKGLITKQEAAHLLTFTHFANPLFILGFVQTLLSGQRKVALMILICHGGTNFLIGFINRGKKKETTSHFTIRKSFSKMHEKRMNNQKSFAAIFKNAIFHSFETLVLMLGTITFFLMVSAMLQELLPMSSLQNTILSGLLEMTQGIKKASDLSLTIPLQAALITFFLSFGGISIHMQVASILSDAKLKYGPYLIARSLHGTISSILVYFLTKFLT